MNMNKILRVATFILLLFSVLAMNIQPAQAQSDEDNVTFALMGEDEISLQGPSDIKSFTYNLPATWEIKDGARLYLKFNTTFNISSSSLVGANNNSVAGYLQVTLNETSLGTILLDQQGETTVELPLYLSAWNDFDPTHPHRLEFTLRTPGPCNDSYAEYASSFNGGLGLLIHPTSYLYLPHHIKPMVTDLRRLPYPLYQDSFLPDSAILVMPDTPSEKELAAVLTTSAVFGRLTEGSLALETITESELSSTHLENSHIIFVGKPSPQSSLDLADWPSPLVDQIFDTSAISQNDGVIQAAVSPLNSNKLWLMVSGMSDEAVLKASQALGGEEEIRVTENVGLSIVSDVQSLQQQSLYSENMTFKDLGYEARDRWGPGIRYIDYAFEVPAGQAVRQGAFLDLVLAHSAMLDMDGSGITVSLNGDYVGSYRFSNASAKVTSWHLELPSSSFRQGENILLFMLNLEATSSCLSYSQLWFAARSESVLHMELIEAPYEEARPRLNKYPSPFVPNLVNTAFIVPKDNSVSWDIASQVAYDLGSETGGVYIDLAVAFADSVPDEIRNERDILLIGQPNEMPFMSELSGNMPAPFDVGSDIATETISGFTFDVSPDIPVGYLEVFLSPWNAQNTVMVISGNSTDGLVWAADSLLDSEKFAELRGNLAVLYDDQIIPYAVDTGKTRAVTVPKEDEADGGAMPATTLMPGELPATDKPQVNLPFASIAIGAISITALVLISFFLSKGRKQK